MLTLILMFTGCRYLDGEGCDAGEAEGYSEGLSDAVAGCESNPDPDRVNQATSGSGAYAASYEACSTIGYNQGYAEQNPLGESTQACD